ncbi:MAG: hypothetical protein [Caudoviricetes sp.]|nr:MAG: hypothetical protein [Caudoviricetes sp.]
MVDYKVGDTVQRIRDGHCGMGVGDTDRVLAMQSDEVTLSKYGSGHDPAKLRKVEPMFDVVVAAKLRAEALEAITAYNAHLALYEPLFKPLVLE